MNEEKELVYRKSLFQTRSKIGCKLHDLITNSGSMDNLVSKEMVRKLHLERMKHLHPYRIVWL